MYKKSDKRIFIDDLLKYDVFNSDSITEGVYAESISDGLILSLSNLGKVDIEYISAVTGADCKTVITTLKGSVFQNPETWGECFYKGWETAEEYLSGNLMRKWQKATAANNEYNGYFADNIKAIEKILPPTVATNDIYITLGLPWVPADIIDDFIVYLFGDPTKGWGLDEPDSKKRWLEVIKTHHDEFTGTWELPYKYRYKHSIGVTQTYGTPKAEALHILEKTLNMKTIAVTDKVNSRANTSGKKRIINKTETLAALEKQQMMIKAFQKWVWQDEKRKERLEKIFENNYSCVCRRIFDGSFLEFPGMSEQIKLYPYQKNAVARIIFTPNTLLAHDVGSGKTYIMIAAGQEIRRMRLSKKNMYVVPNNIVGQWCNIFNLMYPKAKLLCVEPKNFTPQKREKVLRQIRDEDYDGIIIAYSCFEQIPVSKNYYIDDLKKQKDTVNNLLYTRNKSTSKLRKKIYEINTALTKLENATDDLYDTVYFDELGITKLFVDEAHNFKNVPIETKINNTLGIGNTGSKKCKDMLDKVHIVQKQNYGKGVVFATGTPITNSVTDVYVMQMYLQSGELSLLDLQNFDSWVGMFAERKTEFEIDVDTNNYRMATRFSEFHNLPELTSLLSSVADFHRIDKSAGIPDFDGYTDFVISKTPEFQSYLDNISLRAGEVRHGIVSRKDDNMLKITTDGRKAALDLRLVDSNAKFTYQSKTARCAENTANVYFNTGNDKSTQLIFCDISTPKSGFNIYDEIKKELISFGVAENEIAFIHNADTEKKRQLLFSAVRNGSVRILIGSTFKLGLGVNIQDKLIALHHIDVPWRPADMIQREGRILRQGNTNKKIKIFRYITEGSFDAYSWQLLETKQRFISELLSGSLTDRNGSDIDDTVLNYAEIKALAVGNPIIKKRVEISNELTKYLTLQRKAVENKIRMEKSLLELPGKIKNQEESIRKCEEDCVYYNTLKNNNSFAVDYKSKAEEAERRKFIREEIGKAVNNHIREPFEKKLMSYRGFDIILPANMTKNKPYILLVRHGKYYTELGDTEIGNLIRIDNRLDNLGEHLKSLKNELLNLQRKMTDTEAELNRNENYSEQIEQYKAELEELDKKLGVDKK